MAPNLLKQLYKIVTPLLLLFSCSSPPTPPSDDLTHARYSFLTRIATRCIDEGPFRFNYTFRTVLLSSSLISLFGELSAHDGLPHGWGCYEGKTFLVKGNALKEICFDDLFATDAQQQHLKSICEAYFNITLTLHDIRTFVIDHQNVIIIFQPYIIGGLGDSPYFVKIPFTQLLGEWQTGNPIEKNLPITKNFVSSWDENDWICDITPDHSIAY